MTWALAVGAGLSVVSGVANYFGSKSSQKKQERAALLQAQANQASQLQQTIKQNELEQRQLEQNTYDKYKGRLAYSAYNSLDDYAPEYKNKSTGPTLDT